MKNDHVKKARFTPIQILITQLRYREKYCYFPIQKEDLTNDSLLGYGNLALKKIETISVILW